MITIREWMAAIPPEDKLIAYVGEGETVQRQFLLTGDGWQAYTDWSFHLDMAFDLSGVTARESWEKETTTQTQTESITDTGSTLTATETKETRTVSEETVASVTATDIAYLAKEVTAQGLLLTWTVQRQQTQLPGRLRATMRALGPNGEVKKSAIMTFDVQPAVIAEAAAVVPVSEFEEMEQRLGELVSVAEQISAHIDLTAEQVELNAANVQDARSYVEWAEPAVRTNTQLAQTAADTAVAEAEQAEQSRRGAEAHLASARTAADTASVAANTAIEAQSAAETAKSQTMTYLNYAADARDLAKSYAEQAETAVAAAIIGGSATGTQMVRLEDAAEGMAAAVTVSGVDDPTAVTVKRYGKNLLPYDYYDKGTKTVSGITFTDNGNGTITANGTATDVAQYALVSTLAPKHLPPGTYTFSGANAGRHIYYDESGTIKTRNWITDGLTVTFVDGDILQNLYCTVQSGETVKDKVFRPMIELAAAETDYEPYTEPVSFTPAADGTVEGVTTVAPATTLVTETSGAVLTCTYTKDATTVVEGLLERIAALEAAVPTQSGE